MSEVFAKLFDYDGYQVLFTCDTQDETDAPILTIRTHYAGLIFSTAMAFPVSDAGEKLRDKAFAAITPERADELRSNLLSDLRITA